MKKVQRFAIWICSKFTRAEIEEIIQYLSDVLANRNPEVKPKDDFKEKHPNYRNFFVDPESPLTTPPKTTPKLNWKKLLAKYKKQHGHPLEPVIPEKSQTKVPKNSICRICSAPAQYLYYNDGKKRRQLRCKLCGSLSQVHPRHRLKAKFFCPHCGHPLFLWKERKDVSIHKCDNDYCPAFLKNKSKLNFREKLLAKIKSSQFKLRYQFRDYHFTNEELSHSAPAKTSSISNIHNSLNTLCLALTFHVSLGISARKTAFILRNVFSIPCSYQTVLNYSQSAAYYCHHFNLKYKGDVDNIQAGDEAYIKINGENGYTFFFISPERRKITAYHVDESRDTLPATIAMNEAIRTSKPDQQNTFVVDGNPSYPAGIHFLNQSRDPKLSIRKVIGLQNLDSESEEFRPFKQLVERLIRTYKFHIRAACGFNTQNGAVALTTLFVTHYNFLRPHHALGYSVPIPLKKLQDIPTLQGKWAKILHTSFSLN
jgi:transposase-like protein/rubredoxin